MIQLNIGDAESAMENYVDAESYVSGCRDRGAVARLYKAKMQIYGNLYDHNSAIEQGRKAAEYFLKDNDTSRYISTINDIAVQYDVLGDTAAVAECLALMKQYWGKMTDRQKSSYYAVLLLESSGSDSSRIASIIRDYLTDVSDPRYVKWLIVANSYIGIEDYDGASLALEYYSVYDGNEQLPYYWIDAMIKEHCGAYHEALDSYKHYVDVLNKDKLSAIESDTKFIEERYASELNSLRQTYYIIIVSLVLFILALITVVLFQKVKKVKEEKRIQKIRFDKERKILVEEMESMSVSLKAEIEHLERIREDKSIDKSIIATVEERLNVLNMFILDEVSKSYAKLAYAELHKLISDREAFMESTKKIFMVSHPKFIAYLHRHDLTELEIGCCCLYCIGFKGTDISCYLNRKAIYNFNGAIRNKLEIPKGKRHIDVFLRQKMEDNNY